MTGRGLESSTASSMDDVAEKRWNELVADLAEGRTSVLEVMRAGQLALAPDGDYEGFITFRRSYHVLMSDPRIIKRLHEEVGREASKHVGGLKGAEQIARKISGRDGPRLFEKLGETQSELFGDGPSLISGKTFDECLSQYKALIAHVERLWADACRHYLEGHYPLAAFLAILAIEEVGKLGRLWTDLLAWDRPREVTRKDLGMLGRDHRKKHFIGVVSGALINARLDRILGEKRIKQLLQDVDSGKIEGFRQSCLYIDMVDGRIVLPLERIAQEDACFYCVLAGEIWAEVLGHFPWDFKFMQQKVIEFELAAGLDPTLVVMTPVRDASGAS